MSRIFSASRGLVVGALIACTRVAVAAEGDQAPSAPAASPAPAALPAPAAPPTSTGSAPSSAVPAADSFAPGPTVAKAGAGSDDKLGAAADASAADSFTSEDTTDADQQHKLDIYGFADFTYQRLLIPKSNVWNDVYPSVNSFAVGNFNVYLNGNLGDSWRALAEVRFLYLPNGSTSNDSSGAINRTNTTVLDYAGFEEPIRWGGIRIERIYVEHEFNGLLKLQAGQYLTPYGIWNVDHGSPTIIGIKKPFVVSNELFPEQQTGLQLFGSGFLDPFEIGYNLTLSNGRGPVDYEDFSDDKALGGRLYAKTDAIGTLTVGGSFYRGGYYDRSARYVVQPTVPPTVTVQYTTTNKYQELALAADIKWEYQSWLAQGEIIMNEAAFAQGGRPRVSVVEPPQGFQADYRRWGAYGLVGYRLPVVPIMPYAIVQHAYSPDTPQTPPATAYEIGVNVRPTAAVVVKLEYTDWHFSGPGSVGYGSYPLRILASQIAWAF